MAESQESFVHAFAAALNARDLNTLLGLIGGDDFVQSAVPIEVETKWVARASGGKVSRIESFLDRDAAVRAAEERRDRGGGFGPQLHFESLCDANRKRTPSTSASRRLPRSSME